LTATEQIIGRAERADGNKGQKKYEEHA